MKTISTTSEARVEAIALSTAIAHGRIPRIESRQFYNRRGDTVGTIRCLLGATQFYIQCYNGYVESAFIPAVPQKVALDNDAIWILESGLDWDLDDLQLRELNRAGFYVD